MDGRTSQGSSIHEYCPITKMNFNISGIPKIIFGSGKVNELKTLITSFGRNVLLITGAKSFDTSSRLNEIYNDLVATGFCLHRVVVSGEPSPELVDQTVSSFRASGINCVIAIGGGSVIDAGKAIAGLLPFGNSVMDHIEGVGRGIPYLGPPLPFIAVPTTAGTGSEATKNAVLSNRGANGFKKSFRHDSLMPKIALIDPELTFTCPPDVSVAAGMDAFVQLVEGYTSTAANPFTDAIAESGIKAVRDGLQAAYKGIPFGRELMSYAALCSGIVLAHAGLGIVHGLASPLGAYTDAPHGLVCATILPAATKTNINALRKRDPENPVLEKYARVWHILSLDYKTDTHSACDNLIQKLNSWRYEFGFYGLAKYGLNEQMINKIAREATAKTNPVQLDIEAIKEILLSSL